MQETQEPHVRSVGQEDPWSVKWQTTPLFLPGKFQGQKNLAGYSLWSRIEWDTTEHAHTHVSFKNERESCNPQH